MLLILLAIPEILFLVWMIFAIISISHGAPFVVTKKARREIILKLAEVKTGDVAVDLGSGDGSIVIALAQKGIEAHGYEINLLLVLWSRTRVRLLGLQNHAFIHWKSFWKVDLSRFSIVTVYGITHIMKELEQKLEKELRAGTRIVSNTFTFPDWKIEKEEDGIRLYRR